MAKIDLEQIQQLRERTGVGMMDCKNALIEAQGDMEKAVELLRKKGKAVAEKRAGNTTAQGLVHAYIHPGSQVGVLVEINCETDFVARTSDIIQFAQDVALHIVAFNPKYLSQDEVDAPFLEREKAFYMEQLREAGKPEKMIASIAQGKIEKLYTEVCLLAQPFVKNDKLTVHQVLTELIGKMGENIKIKRFVRFEIGS
jgi:elongation factor Ts